MSTSTTRATTGAGGAPSGSWRSYARMARPDHWVKHVFILPGVALAWILAPRDAAPWPWALTAGFASAALAASANYVLNEWLDAESDRHHPVKSGRPAVQELLSRAVVWTLYTALVGAALGLGWIPSTLFFATIVALLLSGWLYNIPPIRTKDRPVLDVLSEAANNPLRLFLGWSMVSASTLPPASLIGGYWMTGAFLMAVKRLAEYRSLVDSVGESRAMLYRRSFRWYSERRLAVSVLLYGQLAAFCLAVFLVKYRIEYVLSLPLFALWFAGYFRLGLKPDSTAQAPERLYREPLLMVTTVALVVSLLVLSWVDIPLLDRLTMPHFIRLRPLGS